MKFLGVETFIVEGVFGEEVDRPALVPFLRDTSVSIVFFSFPGELNRKANTALGYD